MKKLLLFLFVLITSTAIQAETKSMRDSLKHEIRIGVGDQLFESLNFHKTRGKGSLTTDGYWKATDHYRYSQHWFAEYQYRVNHWFGAGAMFDGSGVVWDEIYCNNYGQEIFRNKNHNFYNFVIMPKVRFSYLWHKYVSMHSGFGVGLNVNGGSEIDAYGKKTICSLAIDVTLVGVNVGYKNWFGAVDLGLLIAMKNQNTIFMLGSKMVSASVGYRF